MGGDVFIAATLTLAYLCPSFAFSFCPADSEVPQGPGFSSRPQDGFSNSRQSKVLDADESNVAEK